MAQVQPSVVSLGGGLILNKDVFSMSPGEALQLQNFEPDIEGGYKKILGTTKFNSNIVPQVSASTERVVFSAIFNDVVLAGRGGSIHRGSSGSGSWTSTITSLGTPTQNYEHRLFNFDGTDKIVKRLKYDGHKADAIHGNLRQSKRDRVIKGFRNGHSRILVATDVAARGLDIPVIKHVINYDLPQVAEDYIHRIGRTGRAGNNGSSLTFLTPQDHYMWSSIQKLIDPNFKNRDNLFHSHYSKNKKFKKNNKFKNGKFEKNKKYKKKFKKENGENHSKKKFKKRFKNRKRPKNFSFKKNKRLN